MFTAHFQMASSFVKGSVFKKKKDGSYCVRIQTLSDSKMKAFYSPENVFLQHFCLQRAISPVAQEIGHWAGGGRGPDVTHWNPFENQYPRLHLRKPKGQCHSQQMEMLLPDSQFATFEALSPERLLSGGGGE